jgi:3-oxoadipate enol-lactonase
MAWLTHATERIHYVVEGSGPPVLLLHSLGACVETWSALIAPLRSRYTFIAYDAPGHGQSDYHVTFSIHRSAAIGAQLLQELALPSAALVGVSMGGYTALQMAADHPTRVTAMVLANHSLGGNPAAPGLLDATRRRMEQLAPQQFAEEYVESRFCPGADPRILARYVSSVLAMKPGAYLEAFASIRAQDMRGLAPQLRMPVSVIGAIHDISSPPAMVEAVHHAIPGSLFHLIHNANHFAYLERPDEFSHAVDIFLTDALQIKDPQ